MLECISKYINYKIISLSIKDDDIKKKNVFRINKR